MTDESKAPSGQVPPPEQHAGNSKEPVYKRKWFLPVAMLVVGILVGAVIASGDSGTTSADNEVKELKTQVADLKTELEEVTAERDALKSTGAPSESAPEPEPEPESAAAPTEEDQAAAFAAAFEESRVKLAQVLEDDANVETVDKLAYDPKKKTVTLDVTSTWASPENQIDGAWAIVRLMSTLYEPEEGAWYQEDFVPALVLVNSGRKYTHSGDFMRRLAAFSASRDDWEKECW